MNQSTTIKTYAVAFAIVISLLQGAATASNALAVSPEGLAFLEQVETALVDLAEQVKPSVVNISPLDTATQSPGNRRPDSQRPTPGTGSGFIIDKHGYIVTNNHVVGNADEVEVRLSDKTKYAGKVVGRDKDTDLALVKIETDKDLVTSPFGDSSRVRVGQWVLAVGNPFGLDRTVTLGVVSGMGRTDINLSRYEDFIQTDASINPGNSGGPLFSLTGEVIGINTAIINFAQGIGFAIPSNMAQQIIGQLITHGKVTRGWLGIGIQALTAELAQKFGVSENAGILVNEVFDDDPGFKAGIRPGDIITQVNGTTVDTPSALSLKIASLPPFETVDIEVIREGQLLVLHGELGERKEEAVVASIPPISQSEIKLGLNLQDVTPALAEKFKLSEKTGVMISNVEPDSIGHSAGLREGDVIREVDQKVIHSLGDFTNALNTVTPGQSILLRVVRENRAFYVVMETKAQAQE